MSKSLRVLIVGIVAAGVVYGAALTLALTGHLGTAPTISTRMSVAEPRCSVSASVNAAP